MDPYRLAQRRKSCSLLLLWFERMHMVGDLAHTLLRVQDHMYWTAVPIVARCWQVDLSASNALSQFVSNIRVVLEHANSVVTSS